MAVISSQCQCQFSGGSWRLWDSPVTKFPVVIFYGRDGREAVPPILLQPIRGSGTHVPPYLANALLERRVARFPSERTQFLVTYSLVGPASFAGQIAGAVWRQRLLQF